MSETPKIGAETANGSLEEVDVLAQQKVIIDPSTKIGRFSDVGPRVDGVARVARISLGSGNFLEIVKSVSPDGGPDVFHLAPLNLIKEDSGGSRLWIDPSRLVPINGSIRLGREKGALTNSGSVVDIGVDLNDLGFGGDARAARNVSREQLQIDITEEGIVVTNLALPNASEPKTGHFIIDRIAPAVEQEDFEITVPNPSRQNNTVIVPALPPAVAAELAKPPEQKDIEAVARVESAQDAVADAFAPSPSALEAPINSDSLVGSGRDPLVELASSAAERVIAKVPEPQSIEGQTVEAETAELDKPELGKITAQEIEKDTTQEVRELVTSAFESPENLLTALSNSESPAAIEASKQLKLAVEAFREYDIATASQEAWSKFIAPKVKDLLPKVEEEIAHTRELSESIADFPSIFHQFASAIENDIGQAGEINQKYGVWNRGSKVVEGVTRIAQTESDRVMVGVLNADEESKKLIDRARANKYSQIDTETATKFISTMRELGVGGDAKEAASFFKDMSSKAPEWQNIKEVVLQTAELMDRGSVYKADIKERALWAAKELDEYMKWRNQGGVIRHDVGRMHQIAGMLESIKRELEWADNYFVKSKRLLSEAQ